MTNNEVRNRFQAGDYIQCAWSDDDKIVLTSEILDTVFDDGFDSVYVLTPGRFGGSVGLYNAIQKKFAKVISKEFVNNNVEIY